MKQTSTNKKNKRLLTGQNSITLVWLYREQMQNIDTGNVHKMC